MNCDDWPTFVDALHVRPILKSCDAGCSLLKILVKISTCNNSFSDISNNEWAVMVLLQHSSIIQNRIVMRLQQKKWAWLGYTTDNSVIVDLREVSNVPTSTGLTMEQIAIHDFWAVIPTQPKNQNTMWGLLTRIVGNTVVELGCCGPPRSISPKKRGVVAENTRVVKPKYTVIDVPKTSIATQTDDHASEPPVVVHRPLLLHPLPIFAFHI